ncbi:MAG: hypothetical protein PUC55_01485 [Lachnospiraceae bacterium]|nr:hypothetical protein [Lachnospiraceae bacterium]HCJ08193.1 hypothetical protein [Lachnospiraceae bacterium]
MDMQGFHYNLDSLFPREPDFLEEEEMCQRDCEYMKRLYPRQVRLAASIVEEYLDRYEYEGSPMYVEYPDAVTIYRMAKDVLAMMAKDVDKEKEEQWKNLLQVMVCQEIYVRRRRHDKFCRKFQHSRIR